MFIDNINNQRVHAKSNFLDKDINTENNTESNNFFEYVKTALREISKVQNNAKTNTEKFDLNQSDISLNDIMLNLQKSSIALKMAIQIRNRIVSAYQEVMSQQI